jgi:hypothetical protein
VITASVGPVRHVAMFRFRDGLPAAETRLFDERVMMLCEQVPGVLDVRLDVDLGLRPGHPRACERLLTLSLASPAHAAQYLASDEHVSFVEREVMPRCSTVAAIQIQPAFLEMS